MPFYSFKENKYRFNNQVNTYEDYQNVVAFVTNGIIYGTRNKNANKVQEELTKIGYKKKNHFEYTFMYYLNENAFYGPDFRKIYIKELDRFIYLF